MYMIRKELWKRICGVCKPRKNDCIHPACQDLHDCIGRLDFYEDNT
jgi:hypothetical protein